MKRVEGEEVITKLRIRAKRERERGKIECVTSCCCCTAGGFYTPVCCLLFFFFLFTKIKITSLVFFSLSLLLHLLFIVWWLFDHAVVLIFLVPSLARHPVSAPQPCENRGIFVARARYDDNIDRKAELFIGGFFPTCICRYTRRERLFLIHPSRHRDTGFGIPRAPVASSTWSERPPIRTRLNTLFLVFVRIIACVL